jgi:antitoxin YefM
MKTLSLTEVKAKLSELVDEVESRDERIVITRKGRPAAVLVSQDDLDSWQETLEITSDRALMTELRRGNRQIKRGQTKSYDEVFGPRLLEKKRSPRRAK